MTTTAYVPPATVDELPQQEFSCQVEATAQLENQNFSRIWRADEKTQGFFDRIHLGGKHGFFQAYMDDDKKRSEWREVKNGVVLPMAFVAAANAFFFGVNTASVRVTDEDRGKHPGKKDKEIEPWVGTKNETIDASNCVIAEFDAKDEPDVSDEEVETIFVVMRANDNKTKDAVLKRQATRKAKAIKFATDPDKYMAMAWAKVQALPLVPSVIINSGGGFHVYHFFHETFHITCKADFERLQSLYKRWVNLVKADPASKDVRRLLRVPGRPNKKPAYAPDYPVVHFVKCDLELAYTIDEIEALLPAEDKKPPAPKTVGAYVATGTAGNGEQPLDIFNRENKVEDILLARGYTWFGKNRMSRPGDEHSGGVEIDTENNMSRQWSSNDECCSEYWQRPSNIVITLDYNGDLKKAVREIGTAQRKAKAVAQKAERKAKMEAKRKQNTIATAKAPAFAPSTKVIWRCNNSDTPATIVECMEPLPGIELHYAIRHTKDGFISPSGVPESEILLDDSDAMDHVMNGYCPAGEPDAFESLGTPAELKPIPPKSQVLEDEIGSNQAYIEPDPIVTTPDNENASVTPEPEEIVTITMILGEIDLLPDVDLDGKPDKSAKKFATMAYLIDNAARCIKLDVFNGGKLGLELQKRGIPKTFIEGDFHKAKEAARKAEELAEAARQKEAASLTPKQTKPAHDYAVHDNCIGEWKTYKDPDGNEVDVFSAFCNFNAWIVADVTADDGEAISRKIVLAGILEDGTPLPEIEIDAEDFEPMKWPVAKWGARASIAPFKGTAAMLRHAIQALSGDAMEDRKVYTHTGIRVIDGQRVYLAPSGTIGAPDTSVKLEGNLKYYGFPTDAKVSIRDAMRASIDLLDLAPAQVTYPLLATTYAAPLSEIIPPVVVPNVVGPSGSLKSSLSAVMLNHFGAKFSESLMPTDFLATANRIEKEAFHVKDALLIVDDLRPSTNPAEARALQESVSRIVRAVGNRQGRGRLDSNSDFKRSYAPRGMVMITAERGTVGKSTNSRMLTIDVGPKDINAKMLTIAQGQRHMYGYAMKGFIESVIKDWDELAKALPARVLQLRDESQGSGHHRRLPNATAILFAAFEAAMSFALEVGAIDEDEFERRCSDCREALHHLEALQSETTEAENPAIKYVNTLATLIAQNRAYLAGKRPNDGLVGAGEEKLGWYDGTDVYLLPSAYNTVCKYMNAEGQAFASDEATLRNELDQAGWLTKRNAERNTLMASVPGEKDKKLRCTVISWPKFAEVLQELNVDFRITGLGTNGGAP